MSKHTHPKETPKVQPESETTIIRRRHPLLVFFVKEIRSIILALAVGGVGISSCTVGSRQARDTKWIGDHVGDKQQQIDDLKDQMRDLKQRIDNLDAVGQNNSKKVLPFTAEAGK